MLAPLEASGGGGPARLSQRPWTSDISSGHGSGTFGSWGVDRFGLPVYRYTADEEATPAARQAELGGSTDAWHQVGNDHVVADAFNHGYVQLWSQDRLYQWANKYEGEAGRYAGGFGWLRAGDRVTSTLYDDRPTGATVEREFGVGYARRDTSVGDLGVDEVVLAPFGDDPLLVHQVTIRNTGPEAVDAAWF